MRGKCVKRIRRGGKILGQFGKIFINRSFVIRIYGNYTMLIKLLVIAYT